MRGVDAFLKGIPIASSHALHSEAAKGGLATLYVGSKKVGEGRIGNTIPFLISADETADVAKDEATQVVESVFKDVHDSEFTGYVKSVEVKIPEK